MINKILDVEIDYSKLDCEKIDYQPKLHMYIPNDAKELISYSPKRPTILILPGGAYKGTAEREAEPIALYYLARGYNCFVLRYSCAPARFPVSLAEAAKALLMIKENAEEWRVDTDNIFVCGFSAGGHLAASLGVFWDKPFLNDIVGTKNNDLKFKGLILCYPVLSDNVERRLSGSVRSYENLLGEKCEDKNAVEFLNLENQVSENTPPCFIWHTYEDQSVPVETTLTFALALRKHNIPTELHVFEHGRHGRATGTLTTCDVENRAKIWMDLSVDWMNEEHGGQA